MDQEVRLMLTSLLEGQRVLKAEIMAVKACMATKDDLAALRAEMVTKDELAALRADMVTKDELAALRADMVTKDNVGKIRADLTEVKQRLAQVEAKLEYLGTKWMELDHEVYKLKRK